MTEGAPLQQITEREIRIRQRLKDDFIHYSLKCMKIRNKFGQVRPFELNKAQLYIHKLLEEQKNRTGKVRAIILKGRQQGCCYAFGHKILMADYSWKNIEDVNVGDSVWSIDEHNKNKSITGRVTERRARIGKIEAKVFLKKEAYEVKLSNGVTLKVTGEHRHLCKERGGCQPEWRSIHDCKKGDVIRAFCPPPDNHEPDFEDGWFGGLLDGEGSFGAYPNSRISLSQADGEVLQRAKRYLKNKKIKYYELIDTREAGEKSKFGAKKVHCLRIDRQSDIIKLLSCSRPTRFISRPIFIDKKLPKSCPGFESWVKIVSIKPIGKIKVVDLQTSEKTFICEGLVSHNSTYVNGRFFHLTTHNRGFQTFILTHDQGATNNLFKMVKRYYEHCPQLVRPIVDTSNAKELIFGLLDSGYKIGTARNKTVGRSNTIQLFHGCLAKDTLVRDSSIGGLRKIQDFNVGDHILTHKGNHAQISYISQQEKQCISIETQGCTSIPIICSREHKIFTNYGWVKAEKLDKSHKIGHPVKKISIKIKELIIPLGVKRIQHGGRQFECPNKIKISYNLGRLIGLYLAEGHIKKQSKSPFGVASVSFSVHRKEAKRTMDWVMPFSDYYSSIDLNHRKDCLTSVITVYGSRFATLINNLCGRTSEKHFPLEWFKMGKDFCTGMVHGYLAGDGHIEKGSRRIKATSICSAITLPLRDILASLGYGWASISIKEAAIRHGRNEKQAYIISICGNGADVLANELGNPYPERKRELNKLELEKIIEISKGHAWIPIKSISLDKKRKVYDFEVDHKDHSYCIINGATHNSETGFWENAAEHSKGIFQAIPDSDGSEIILESTANGVGNFFHQQWQKAEAGQSEFIAIFVPWFWQDEYFKQPEDGFVKTNDEADIAEQYGLSDGQIYWRRLKIETLSINGQDGEKSFRQEYPLCSGEAFIVTGEDSYLDATTIARARKTKAEKFGPIVIGVDPARFGDDRTSIIRRQGRVAYGLESYTKKDTMEVVGIVAKIIQSDEPAKVFIDVGGLGAGIVDRLNELGYGDVVVAVNAGSSPLDAQKYKNKRAEMWGELKLWLNDEPCQIPDIDSLHADMINTKYKFDSNSRLVMESKEDMKRRGIRSSDEADALCLTFSEPATAFQVNVKRKSKVKDLANHFNNSLNSIKRNYHG